MGTPIYFVIQNIDGDTLVAQKTEEQLLATIQPNEWGDVDIMASDILETAPGPNTSYWGNRVLIIKGEIIVPKAVEFATRFEL